ncbi:hypothetical protein [Mariniluteicoccus flavus]
MATVHPHLDEQVRKRRSRSLKTVVGVAAMGLVVIAALLFIISNAGRWGVPMFSFTNEHGSHCKNQFIGQRCEPMTLADIEARAEADIPDDAQIVSAVFTKTHDYDLDARLIYPAASAEAGVATLVKEFGECRPGIPTPLTQIPGVKDVCTMTNIGRISTDGKKPDPRIWQVSKGLQPDGRTAVHLHVRSR